MKHIPTTVLLSLSIAACRAPRPDPEAGPEDVTSGETPSGTSGMGPDDPGTTSSTTTHGTSSTAAESSGPGESSTSDEGDSGAGSNGEPSVGTLPAFGEFWLYSRIDAGGGNPRGRMSGGFFSDVTVPKGACDPFDGDCGIEDGCNLNHVFGGGGAGQAPPSPTYVDTDIGPSFNVVHDDTTELQISRREDGAYFSRDEDAASYLPGVYDLHFNDEVFDDVVEVPEPPALSALPGDTLPLVPGEPLELNWTPQGGERIRLRVDGWGNENVLPGLPGDIIQLICYGDDDGSLIVPADLTSEFSADTPKGYSPAIAFLSNESWSTIDDGERQFILHASGETVVGVDISEN